MEKLFALLSAIRARCVQLTVYVWILVLQDVCQKRLEDLTDDNIMVNLDFREMTGVEIEKYFDKNRRQR